jgi:hypothetical protein
MEDILLQRTLVYDAKNRSLHNSFFKEMRQFYGTKNRGDKKFHIVSFLPQIALIFLQSFVL